MVALSLQGIQGHVNSTAAATGDDTMSSTGSSIQFGSSGSDLITATRNQHVLLGDNGYARFALSGGSGKQCFFVNEALSTPSAGVNADTITAVSAAGALVMGADGKDSLQLTGGSVLACGDHCVANL